MTVSVLGKAVVLGGLLVTVGCGISSEGLTPAYRQPFDSGAADKRDATEKRDILIAGGGGGVIGQDASSMAGGASGSGGGADASSVRTDGGGPAGGNGGNAADSRDGNTLADAVSAGGIAAGGSGLGGTIALGSGGHGGGTGGTAGSVAGDAGNDTGARDVANVDEPVRDDVGTRGDGNDGFRDTRDGTVASGEVGDVAVEARAPCLDNLTCTALYGSGSLCWQGRCTTCTTVTDSQFWVDPVNGDDAVATGSATPAASCAFRTVTKALQTIGPTAPAGTTVTIVGKGGSTELCTSSTACPVQETLPIDIPANVTVTTSGGPIHMALAKNQTGFRITGDRAALAPTTTAVLAIDGSANISGNGLVFNVASGSASLRHVVIQNTGSDGILVSLGTANIGAGVSVSQAGKAAVRQSGMRIIAGTANIAVAANEAATDFSNNTLYGIYVAASGTLTVQGQPNGTTGKGSVIVQGNYTANLCFQQQPGTVATASVIAGIVAWGATGHGLRLYGGSNVRVRNSVILANQGSGVMVSAYDGTLAGNDLTKLDLGKANDFGRNTLQDATTGNANLVAGICTQMSRTVGNLALPAAGNTFAGPRDCSQANPGTLTRAARTTNCGAGVDLGTIAATGTTVTYDISNCR